MGVNINYMCSKDAYFLLQFENILIFASSISLPFQVISKLKKGEDVEEED